MKTASPDPDRTLAGEFVSEEGKTQAQSRVGGYAVKVIKCILIQNTQALTPSHLQKNGSQTTTFWAIFENTSLRNLTKPKRKFQRD